MITQEDIDAFELPEWAERRAEGEYRAIRCALPTRDGRRTGNAVNAGTYRNATETTPIIYNVITDVGNHMLMSHSEMVELFHPPKWIMIDLLHAHEVALRKQEILSKP